MTNSKPLVFVGVLAYNRPDGLRNTLTALTAQSYQHLEIHVSDDSSPNPAVMAVIEEFAKRDPRVKAHHQKQNLGIIRNHQFLLTKVLDEAAYVMWACDDDDWHQDYIKVCLEALEKHPKAILCSTVHLWRNAPPNHELNYYENTHTLEVNSMIKRYEQVLSGILWWNHTFYGVIRKEAFNMAKLQQHFSFDILFIARLSIHGPFIRLPQAYFTKTIRGYGSSMKSNLASIKVKSWFTYLLPRLKMCIQLSRDAWSSQLSSSSKIQLTRIIFSTVLKKRIYESKWKRLWNRLSNELRNLFNFESTKDSGI